MVFSLICSVITFLMCLLHMLLFLGAPIGEYVLGGKDRVIPKNRRYVNAVLACVFFFIGLLYLREAGIFAVNVISRRITKIIMTFYTLFLGYAIFGNIFFTKSRKEKMVMIPFSVLGFISSLLAIILN